jgi:uncharacterized protein Yka (UPF0111/DUF47 family)
MPYSPFDTIESAEEFLMLLSLETEKTHTELSKLLENTGLNSGRRVEALRLVLHKLDKLQQNTEASRRILNDLRTLRTLLLR